MIPESNGRGSFIEPEVLDQAVVAIGDDAGMLPRPLDYTLVTGPDRSAIKKLNEPAKYIPALSIKLFGPMQVLVQGQPIFSAEIAQEIESRR